VAAAMQEASLQAQIDATRQLIDINSNMVQILRYQLPRVTPAGWMSPRRNRSSRSRRHAAAAAQATGPAARSAGRAGRPVSEPGAAEKFELSSLHCRRTCR
jgi:hypothetical protein